MNELAKSMNQLGEGDGSTDQANQEVEAGIEAEENTSGEVNQH